MIRLAKDTLTQILQLVRLLAEHFGVIPTPDRFMATVTSSIGTSSRDYSTITSWEGDLDNGGVYSSGDDAVGECYNDSAFDENVTINGGGTVGLNSVTLTVPSAERHDGTEGTGARNVSSANKATILVDFSIDCEVSWLEIDGIENLDAGGSIRVDDTSDTCIVRNMIFHDCHDNVTSVRVVWGSRDSVDFCNCFIYNVKGTSTSVTTLAIQNSNLSAKTVRFLNITAHDFEAINGSSNDIEMYQTTATGVDITIKNCIGTDIANSGAGAAACYTGTQDTANNNLSSDATAPGTSPQTSKASSDQFVSNSSPYDLHLKTGADAIDNGADLGTTPDGVQYDIDNRDRDANGDTWDIGADELVAAASGIAPLAFSLIHKMANA